MPSSDQEVFEELTGGASEPSAIDYLTYSIFAYERREWILHRANGNNGVRPTQAEIDNWISNLTPSQFREMRVRAAGTFDISARDYMADDIEQARQETLRSSVVREVKAAGNFWRQLFIALVTAILAPVIVGLIVVAALRSDDIISSVQGAKKMIEGNKSTSKSTDDTVTVKPN